MRRLTGLLLLLVVRPGLLAEESAEVRDRGAWVSASCVELSDLKGFRPVPAVPLDRYGGWLDTKARATGFFHTIREDGRWWVVDPEGHLFLSIGVNSVQAPTRVKAGAGDEADGVAAKPAAEEVRWATQATDLLRGHGFNTAGCWSSTDAIRGLKAPMPYCLRWNFMAGYRSQRRRIYPGTGTAEAIYPFDPEFATFCEQRAAALEATKDDPWLFGHFSDNELPLHEADIVSRYLSFPADDPCHRAAARFMAAREGKPGRDDDREFLELVVSEYYRTVAAAIRKHDPHHMFLGSRFHGRALESPALFAGAGPHADIISVNYYHRWTPENGRIARWAKTAGKPILITEWYAKGEDSGLSNEAGAGFLVRSQDDRARFYRNFSLALLANPDCVGWHWFKYRDSPVCNAGVVDSGDQPYARLLDAMQEINGQAYPLAQWLLKR